MLYNQQIILVRWQLRKLGNVRNCMVRNEIRFRVELAIEGSKIEEYKKLVQDMVRVVEANEPIYDKLRILP